MQQVSNSALAMRTNTTHRVSMLCTMNISLNRLQVALLCLLPSPASKRGASSAKTVRATPFMLAFDVND